MTQNTTTTLANLISTRDALSLHYHTLPLSATDEQRAEVLAALVAATEAVDAYHAKSNSTSRERSIERLAQTADAYVYSLIPVAVALFTLALWTSRKVKGLVSSVREWYRGQCEYAAYCRGISAAIDTAKSNPVDTTHNSLTIHPLATLAPVPVATPLCVDTEESRAFASMFDTVNTVKEVPQTPRKASKSRKTTRTVCTTRKPLVNVVHALDTTMSGTGTVKQSKSKSKASKANNVSVPSVFDMDYATLRTLAKEHGIRAKSADMIRVELLAVLS